MILTSKVQTIDQESQAEVACHYVTVPQNLLGNKSGG